MIVDSWNGYFDYFEDNQKDIYYYEEYVKLYESQDSQAKCIVCRENDNILIMPFIRKETDSYYDFETAYGYGGPIVNTECREWIDNALVAAETFFLKIDMCVGLLDFIHYLTMQNTVHLKFTLYLIEKQSQSKPMKQKMRSGQIRLFQKIVI